MIIIKSQVSVQTLTQLCARALMYAAMLLVLPSFITIADSATYADIVLISTLAALSAQFDGGHATGLAIALSSSSTKLSREYVLLALNKALIGTLKWSLLLSTAFTIVWLAVAPTNNGYHNPFIVFTSGVILAVTCALSNTATRVLFAKGISYSCSLLLIGGPLIGFTLVLILRIEEYGSVEWISASFVAGYLFIIIGTYIFSLLAKKTDVTIRSTENNSVAKSTRYWVFFSQIIGIFLAAKNPFLIRLMLGDSDLGLFSIYSACYSLMLAPAAAMQIPALVRFRALIIEGNKEELIKSIMRQILFVVFISFFIGLIIYFSLSTEVIISYFNKVGKIKKIELLFVIFSAIIASASVILATYLTAVGELRSLAWMSVLVLIVDTFLVYGLAEKFGGVTPLVTVIIANIFASAVYFLGIKKALRRR
jgi:O-antigen/teichoic acid export membrane protein